MRAIAFYLPQFHPIPENDAWWGEGFTEWTNVRKAEPRFSGHYQPHVPGQLGYYDLRDPEVRQAQAELARAHGIHGFCYYHYWFGGKRLLETPVHEVLQTGKPDFPFCLCWANENWTRRWDGEEREVLMAQDHSHADDLAHIESLFPAFRDERYIRVNGKPLFLVYKTNLLPDPKKTAEIWREAAHKAGIGEIYLVRVENYFQGYDPSPMEIGFDAAAEFAPHWGCFGEKVSDKIELFEEYRDCNPLIYDYDNIMLGMLGKPKPDYKLFRGVFPSWDNSARRLNDPVMFVNSSPEKYAFWLSQIARYTYQNFSGDEQFVFINAWNEWGEGCHLEPDGKYGLRHLEATRLALGLARDLFEATEGIKQSSGTFAISPEKWYELLADVYRGSRKLSADELNMVAAFGPYVFFAMAPMLDKGIQDQFNLALNNKDRQIAELYDSLSWKITAPLRKIFDMFFK
ncbi:MAG: glycoside hydrolase family 99-like domain-containing protein [Desulfuromonadales bacterium]|nr:glycoside hydrolase family 99-like domain-containing protein [Desulfuromonadales bacterium]